MNGEPKMPYYEALEITVSVFVHTEKLSLEPNDGIRKLQVPILLSRFKKNGLWRIESVDRSEMDLWCPEYKRRNTQASALPVVKALIAELDKRGICPSSVRGWSRYFDQRQVRDAEEWRQTSQLAQKA